MKNILIFFIFYLYANHAHAIEEVFRYKRCYAQFVREKIKSTDELLMLVERHKLRGADACLKLLDNATIGPGGHIARGNLIGQKILKTFQSFHRQWFPEYNLNVSTEHYTASDFYDVNEMGYHLTFALFKGNVPFSRIVTSPSSFRGIRVAPKRPKFFYDDAIDTSFERFGKKEWERGDDHVWTPRLIDFGVLDGIKEDNCGINFIKKSLSDKFTEHAENKSNKFAEHDANKSIGAGVIGTIPYLLLNSGQNYGIMDGEYKDHRRWSKAILSDLLCRDLPVIKIDDAKQFVRAESKVSFKKKKECMQCHATIDNLAGVIRNVQLYQTSLESVRFSVRAVYVHNVKPSSKEYYNSSTNGRIFFRNYKDDLINIKIKSINELGNWLASSDDFYICSAKKYFNFLTGNDVAIDHFRQKKDDEYKNFIIAEGIKFKRHQSVKALLKDIIESPFYLRKL